MFVVVQGHSNVKCHLHSACTCMGDKQKMMTAAELMRKHTPLTHHFLDLKNTRFCTIKIAHFTTIMKIIPSIPSWEDLKDPISVWSKLKILLWISGAQLRITVSLVLIMSQSCLKAAAGEQAYLNTVSWNLNCNIDSRDYQASYKLWYRVFSLA